MNRQKPIFALIVIASLSHIGARGQSINIDLDEMGGTELTGNGVPSSSYGAAANQPGVWNRVYEGGPPNLTPLVGLDGLPTSCRIIATGGIGSGGGFNNSGISGDYRLLMGDFADVGDPVTYHFSGFASGPLEILTFACDPSTQSPFDVSVNVPGATIPIRHVTGPMPSGNQFVEGKTHSVHFLTLTSGTFDIIVSGTFAHTRVNGFQLVRLPVPEPLSAFVYILGVAVVLVLRRLRM